MSAAAPRTAEATAARLRIGNDRLCREITGRLESMPDDMLAALAQVVLTEHYRRRARRGRR